MKMHLLSLIPVPKRTASFSVSFIQLLINATAQWRYTAQSAPQRKTESRKRREGPPA